MQHQLGIAAEQPRGVDAQGEVVRQAGGLYFSSAACASRSTHALFIWSPRRAVMAARRRHIMRDPAKWSSGLAKTQLRFDHQPMRRGLAASSLLSATAGAGGGEGGGAGGVSVLALPKPGAGSRTVERRRGASELAGDLRRGSGISGFGRAHILARRHRRRGARFRPARHVIGAVAFVRIPRSLGHRGRGIAVTSRGMSPLPSR
jgi:hypothetical protein